MMLASLAFAYSGFAMLCSTTRRYFAQNSLICFSKWSVTRAILLLRLVGLIFIAIALMYCMSAWGSTVGIAASWLVLAIAAYLVVLTATYIPKKLAYMALACLIVAVFATVTVLW